MEWQGQALRLLDALQSLEERVRGLVVAGDVGALGEAIAQEQALAQELRALSQERPASTAAGGEDGGAVERPASELKARAEAVLRLHRQNRMLLDHAHRTALELLHLMTADSTTEGVVYAPPGERAGALGEAARSGAGPRSVDRRV
ncbi:flagellar export chaperone FlgN [Carboxydochorda subterranea]|uniref:Flagellar export chaperone FlgN n=1 Tax=Carboxydichorda subterranea TaxID=3109565 RepID=A0ABZ1BZ87_9FIRM|nr:flagellar export chaperone FlgN [Limnochorda sp. L945t]WRP17880.1 flagellar export chaperone FlgN [Limnochorda sp. L945t]